MYQRWWSDNGRALTAGTGSHVAADPISISYGVSISLFVLRIPCSESDEDIGLGIIKGFMTCQLQSLIKIVCSQKGSMLISIHCELEELTNSAYRLDRR